MDTVGTYASASLSASFKFFCLFELPGFLSKKLSGQQFSWGRRGFFKGEV